MAAVRLPHKSTDKWIDVVVTTPHGHAVEVKVDADDVPHIEAVAAAKMIVAGIDLLEAFKAYDAAIRARGEDGSTVQIIADGPNAGAGVVVGEDLDALYEAMLSAASGREA